MRTIILALAFISSAAGATITLTMDEVANQAINGLTVSKGGVDFTFSDPSGFLQYNSSGPGTLTYIQDPSVQGLLAPYGITFSIPVNSIQFGLAVSTNQPVSPLATVELFFNSPTPFATLTFDSSVVDPFAEGQFNYAGQAMSSILITPSAGAAALAFDNLTVNTVPEPATVSMFAGGLALVAVRILMCKASNRPTSTRS